MAQACHFLISLIAFCFFFIGGWHVRAQDYSSLGGIFPPSPEAIALAAASSTEVDLYRGRQNYRIPLYTIRVGDLAFPISLDYIGGNGIKVSEVASSAGWS